MSEVSQKRITRAWLDGFLTGAFPGVMSRAAGVADFLRLVELDRRLHPVKPAPRQVVWLDQAELDPDFMRS